METDTSFVESSEEHRNRINSKSSGRGHIFSIQTGEVAADKLITPNQHGYGTGNGGIIYSNDSHVVDFSKSMETGSTVSFHDINYSVNTKIDGVKAKKVILKDINGVFGPGMNAILGPTGSGKTSLLDVLAARKDPNGLKGTVLIDGAPQPENFRLCSGYVVQDDVVMGTLTVRENLAFSASLRLSKKISKKEKKERVEDIIMELGLTKCADTKVGTDFIRGVSGGERKRTNIGMELIIKPSVLFLDEPTTGLDASTANAVMLLLAKLSRRGRTIIFSIHQPRYSIFKTFEFLHLLSLGETVYHGPANEALTYFSDCGFVCEEHNNPADFFLDVINGDSTAVASVADVADEYNVKNRSHSDTAIKISSESDSESKQTPLVKNFMNSKYYTAMQENTKRVFSRYQQTETVTVQKIDYPTSFLHQLGTVSVRAVKNIIRNPMTSIFQFVVMVIFSLIVGGIYFQLDTSRDSGIQNRVGVFFFLVMNMVFSNLSALELFINERVVFMHESASGFYRVSAYFFSKVFCDLIPMRIIPNLGFCCITYWMIGLKPTAFAFFFFYLQMILTTICACALSFFMSASIGIMAIATLALAMSYVFMMVFGGLLINIESLPEFLQWLQYGSIFRYSTNALAINELTGMQFCDVINGTEVNCIPGEGYLISQGIRYDTWGLWQNTVAVVAILVGFMFLAYVQLRRIPKYK
ncbi:broad substrate specificity ATP-binding cassette transporter ABCG2-like isoform X1 [Amphiura filiformis]|uniref:broad substrate specificity ATP-binding cassette transporter ABCG2-like isoform X1 n=1 Tax=Amphiura filiformis TaxID=82378 RepID=UPI003B214BBD